MPETKMIDRTDAIASSVEEPIRLKGSALAGVLAGLLLALALSALDATIVGTALPQIVRDLHGLGRYSWVVTAYLLTSTTMVPIVGKLSDQFGRKRFLLAGIVLFMLGSALAGTSRTMTQLILFRGLQGLGTGFIQASAFTVVADLFPPAERGKWQGLFVSTGALALIVGPVIGGVITEYTSWHWVFYVNLPIGTLALLLLMLWLPAAISVPATSYRGWAAVRRIDFPGALTGAAATACLLLGLT
jgi:multidrug resistance protein